MDKKDAKAIMKIVSGFRKGILAGGSQEDMCFAVCWPLRTLLEVYGYPCKLTHGGVGDSDHFWLTMPDGTIVDPTADQFRTPDGGEMPKIYMGKKPYWYAEDVDEEQQEDELEG